MDKWNIGTIPQERWYAFSINIDPSWQDSTASNNPTGTSIAQWHTNTDPGEPAKSPHLSIMVQGSTFQVWRIDNLSDPNPITTHSPQSYTKRTWRVGPVIKGQWVDWVVYAKWSYNSDGVLKIWKNSNIVVDHRGPNTYNDKNPQFFKFGIYNWWWSKHTPSPSDVLTAYYDEIKIGDKNSSYENVAPGR
jgi:hypothetical protein